MYKQAWDFSLEHVGISHLCSWLTWCHYAKNARNSRKVQKDKVTCVVRGLLAMLERIACRSKKQDAGMLTGNAKRIFCDNVTCFGTNKSCSNRRHLSEFFIKALRFLLAWSPCSFSENPRFFYFLLGGDIRNMCGTIHTLGWKMSLFFFVWHPPCFRFFVSNTLKGITKVQVPWVQNTKPCVTGRANIWYTLYA